MTQNPVFSPDGHCYASDILESETHCLQFHFKQILIYDSDTCISGYCHTFILSKMHLCMYEARPVLCEQCCKTTEMPHFECLYIYDSTFLF